jgi:hypothetical protein
VVDEEWAVGEPDPSIQAIADSSHDPAVLRGVILNYTTYKHSGFTKAPAEYGESDKALAAFQRALELPKSLDRKVRQYLEESPDETAIVSDESIGKDAARAMALIRPIDADYTDIVNALHGMAGDLSEAEMRGYDEWLAAHYPVVIDSGIIATSGFGKFISQG